MSVSTCELQTRVLGAFRQGIQIKVPQYTGTRYIHTGVNETTEQQGNFFFFFFFNMIECDWSTRPVRQKVDWQTPQSVQTLSIDWPLHVHCILSPVTHVLYKPKHKM